MDNECIALIAYSQFIKILHMNQEREYEGMNNRYEDRGCQTTDQLDTFIDVSSMPKDSPINIQIQAVF